MLRCSLTVSPSIYFVWTNVLVTLPGFWVNSKCYTSFFSGTFWQFLNFSHSLWVSPVGSDFPISHTFQGYSKSDLKPWSVFGTPLILYQWGASWCGFSNQHLFFWLPGWILWVDGGVHNGGGGFGREWVALECFWLWWFIPKRGGNFWETNFQTVRIIF